MTIIFFSYLIYVLMCLSLGTEIAYEPQFAEMNMVCNKNYSYNFLIKNIGSQDINLGFSAEGLNDIPITFNPARTCILCGDMKVIQLNISTTKEISGDYNGFICIWNLYIPHNILRDKSCNSTYLNKNNMIISNNLQFNSPFSKCYIKDNSISWANLNSYRANSRVEVGQNSHKVLEKIPITIHINNLSRINNSNGARPPSS